MSKSSGRSSGDLSREGLGKRGGRDRAGRRQEYEYEQLLKDDPSGMAMLDRALEGASDTEKARVRGVLLDYGIEVEHEFYIVFVAIGHLLVLVKEAPENWRSLFDDVHRELKLWSKENFKSLESIKLHAQTSAELIAVLRQLLVSMKNSQRWSSQTSQDLNTLRLRWLDTDSSLTDLEASSQQQRQQLSQVEAKLLLSRTKLDKLRTQSSEMAKSLSGVSQHLSVLSEGARNRRTREWILSCSLVVLGVVAIGQFFGNRAMQQQLVEQERVLAEQREQVGWLFDKANRAECIYGIKPPDDRQCRQFFPQ